MFKDEVGEFCFKKIQNTKLGEKINLMKCMFKVRHKLDWFAGRGGGWK